MNGPVETVNQRAAGLGDAGVEKIGSDRGCRMNAEQQNEYRRHQRSAADARQADDGADREAGHDEQRIDVRKEFQARAPPQGRSYYTISIVLLVFMETRWRLGKFAGICGPLEPNPLRFD